MSPDYDAGAPGMAGRRTGGGFMGSPYAAKPAGHAFMLGLPFDTGTHAFRVGARQGPTHVRACSALIRRFHAEFNDADPLSLLDFVDCGDVDVTPSLIAPAFERIESVLSALLAAAPSAVAYTVGGDGSVSLPQLRAVARRHPDLVVIHFDAHTDCVPPPAPGVHHSGTQFRYAATEGLVDPRASFHLGIRGSAPARAMVTHAEELGYRCITTKAMLETGLTRLMTTVRDTVGQRPVYVCFDMDVLDPSCSPGVASPSWGGLLAREALQLVRELRGMNVVHFDLNTVSPPHDVQGLTGSLAAALLYEAMTLQGMRLTSSPNRADAVPQVQQGQPDRLWP